MPSRRRTANKNLANNLAEVQRRLRTLERRPVRSELGNRSVSGTAISPNSVDATQVSFGVNLVAQVDPISGDPTPILNPQDGQQVFDPNSGLTTTYSATYDAYIETSSSDTYAQSIALAAQASADGKNTIYRQSTAPTGGTYSVGDIWFDESNNSRINKWNGTAWIAFTLGTNAVANLNASVITTGEINAANIIVSNLDASKITTGTLTGRTVQTSDTGARVKVTNNDAIEFYNISGTLISTITPFDYANPSTVSKTGLSIYTPDYNEWLNLDTGILDMGTFNNSGSTNITMYAPGALFSNTDSIVNIGADNINLNGTNVHLGGAFLGGGAVTITINGQLALTSSSVYSSAPTSTDGNDGDVRFVL